VARQASCVLRSLCGEGFFGGEGPADLPCHGATLCATTLLFPLTRSV